MQITSLEQIGNLADEDIPLSDATLLLSASHASGVNLARYRTHLKQIARDVGARFSNLIEAGAENSAATQLAALKHVISDQYGYGGDDETYDDLQNADLVRVIDRRKGLPIALSIIALHAGRAQGWDIQGINFPGHFLLRLQFDGNRLIADPYEHFKVMQAADLRSLLKQIAGEEAELSVSYYEASTSRDILVRLQNNIKHRQIEHEDYAGALKTVEQMRVIAPDENRLLFDAGILYARTGQIQAAIGILDRYVAKAASHRDRQDALVFLASLRESLQ